VLNDGTTYSNNNNIHMYNIEEGVGVCMGGVRVRLSEPLNESSEL
jgi:hypothetical protein